MRIAKMTIPTVFALAVLAGAAVPTALYADTESDALRQLSNPVVMDSTLKRLVGLWKGNGELKRGSDQQIEAVKCRLTNSWAAEGKLLKMQLACRGVDYQFTATSLVGRSGSRYMGALTTTRGDRGTISGRASGSRLNLTVTTTAGEDAGRTATLAMALSGNSLTNKFLRTDPKTGVKYTALDVTMTN